jgi:hypothetical protein
MEGRGQQGIAVFTFISFELEQHATMFKIYKGKEVILV